MGYLSYYEIGVDAKKIKENDKIYYIDEMFDNFRSIEHFVREVAYVSQKEGDFNYQQDFYRFKKSGELKGVDDHNQYYIEKFSEKDFKNYFLTMLYNNNFKELYDKLQAIRFTSSRQKE